MGGKVDLHVHSTCSDGTLSPYDTVKLAYERGISHFALSDHDTVAGTRDAVKIAKQLGMWTVPAVEISTDYVSPYGPSLGKTFELHLLGYGFDPDHGRLLSTLEFYTQKRNERLKQILSNLNQKLAEERQNPDIKENREPVDIDAFCEYLQEKDGSVGRPIIADWLVEHGYVKTRQDAFDKWLIKCDVPKEPFPVADAAKLVREAGGIAVLGHPYSLKVSLAQMMGFNPKDYLNLPDSEVFGIMAERGIIDGFSRILEDMVSHGIIDGIEAIYIDHFLQVREFFVKEALRLELMVTAGSDHHGAAESNRLGRIDAYREDVLGFVERFS